MSHDPRFPNLTENELWYRRIGGLIAICALLGVLLTAVLLGPGADEAGPSALAVDHDGRPFAPHGREVAVALAGGPLECTSAPAGLATECLYY